MAIAAVLLFRPRPGRLSDFMKDVARAGKIVTRCGGEMRVWSSMYGGEPGTVGIVVETADWKAHGDYQAKVLADSEYLAFLAELNSTRDPSADLLGTQVLQEVPVG
jgi:hypothetical protein